MEFLSKKSVVLVSLFTTLIMFVVVMFLVNPMIDGSNGLNVIALQLAFTKETGIEVAKSLDANAFQKWIWTDYLYALSYMMFFASLISWLLKRRSVKEGSRYHKVIIIVLLAGIFDWIENSLELWFLYDVHAFSSSLFFVHSLIAMLKWLALPIIVVSIVLLVKKELGGVQK